MQLCTGTVHCHDFVVVSVLLLLPSSVVHTDMHNAWCGVFMTMESLEAAHPPLLQHSHAWQKLHLPKYTQARDKLFCAAASLLASVKHTATHLPG